MNSKFYLDKILKTYSSSYDIFKNYNYGDLNFSAYGYFNSKAEKYILVKEVNLWEVNSFEHVFFIEMDELREEDLIHYENLLKEKLEKKFVRNNKRYPDKNHMNSYITFIFITSSKIDEKLKKKIEKFKFEKTYLFSIRGFFTTKLLVVDLEKNKIFYNKPSKDIKNIFENILNFNKEEIYE